MRIAGIFSTISTEQAEKLPHRTARLPLPGREDEYMVTLDVFHVLHCLVSFHLNCSCRQRTQLPWVAWDSLLKEMLRTW